jgi:hypothetical protein
MIEAGGGIVTAHMQVVSIPETMAASLHGTG